MQTIITNFGTVANRILSGREYLVAPITLIVEGVLTGSQGSLYYPVESFQNSDRWNGMPILKDHPVSGSARTPEVISSQSIGTLYNAQVDGSKLKAHGWFDLELLNQVAPDIRARLANGEKIEVSTGLIASLEKSPVGAIYNFTVKDIEPDHLAILPNATGACSVRDGCGVLNTTPGDKMKQKELVDSLIANSCCWEEGDREVLQNFTVEKLQSFSDAMTSQEEMTVVFNAAVESFTDSAKNVHTYDQEAKVWNSEMVEVEEVELTEEEWMVKAPEAIKNMIVEKDEREAKEKEEIIEKLTANLEDKDEVKNELQQDSLERLRKLVVLAVEGKPVVNYSGKAEEVKAVNSSGDKKDILPLP